MFAIAIRSPIVQHGTSFERDLGSVGVAEKMSDWTVILELGAEGGSLTLLGKQTERSWVFYRHVSDWTPELIGEGRIENDSPAVHSWEVALGLLDKYNWHKLTPLIVDPGFSDRVWSAVRDRFENDRPREINRCSGGCAREPAPPSWARGGGKAGTGG
jgi:hypothetical protein